MLTKIAILVLVDGEITDINKLNITVQIFDSWRTPISIGLKFDFSSLHLTVNNRLIKNDFILITKYFSVFNCISLYNRHSYQILLNDFNISIKTIPE
jgi:hypothetical protein